MQAAIASIRSPARSASLASPACSAAQPCSQTLAAAASRPKGSPACDHRPASQPASTSPLPAVPSLAFPVGLTSKVLPTDAITVPEPLSTTTACNWSASACALCSRCACTVAALQPSRRAASKGCGVSTVGWPRVARARSATCSAGSAANALSASASSTSLAAWSSTGASSAPMSWPPPQPHTTVARASRSGASAACTLRGISSGRAASGDRSSSILAK